MIHQKMILLLILNSGLAISQTRVEQQKLQGSTIDNFSYFGVKHDSHQNRVIIGAMYHKHNDQTDAGAAFIFERDEKSGWWQETGYLTASDAFDSDAFGRAVAIHGDTALIGAPWATITTGQFTGKAYVFALEQGVWSEQQILDFPDGSELSQSQFGISVGANATHLMVGAPGAINHNDLNHRGAVCVYENVNGDWIQTQKLNKPENTVSTHFGDILFVNDTQLIINGGSEEDVLGEARGVAYSYAMNTQNQWELSEVMWAPADTIDRDFLGFSAVSANKMFIYARNNNVPQPEYDGLIHIMRKTSTKEWVSEGEVSPGSPQEAEYYGTGAYADDLRLLVGADDFQVDQELTRVTYFYEYGNGQWVEKAQLIPSTLSDANSFATSMVLNGHQALVGSYLENSTGIEAGASYVFDLDLIFADDWE